jgi:hypothetical protein
MKVRLAQQPLPAPAFNVCKKEFLNNLIPISWFGSAQYDTTHHDLRQRNG